MKKIIGSLTAILILTSTVLISCEDSKAKMANQTISNDSLIKRGEYLVTISGCDDCHTPKKMGAMGHEPDRSIRLSGYRMNTPLPRVDTNVIKSGWALANGELTGWAGPWGASFAANLTSDETGIGNWTLSQFKKALREGKWKGMDGNRPLMPPMPWQNYSHFTDEDVASIFAFLKSTKPVKNVEPNIVAFSDLK
ncbi:MAG: c-type cytochrome [Ferruginibacter sp.]